MIRILCRTAQGAAMTELPPEQLAERAQGQAQFDLGRSQRRRQRRLPTAA